MKKLASISLLLILIGMSITGYLSYIHYSGNEATCPLQPSLDCNAVLNSSYSTAVGIPVAVLGFATYLILLVCLLIHEQKESKQNDRILLTLPAFGVMAAGFYTTLMLFRLGAICIWCEGSHLIMLILFVLMARHIHPHWSYKNILIAWIIFFILGGSLTLFIASDAEDNPNILTLAKCLTSKNVKMYGTYWCPHCQEQKRLFGSAFKEINYVECADTANPKIQLAVCENAKIEGYPTWGFANERISGTRDLETLAKLAGCEFS